MKKTILEEALEITDGDRKEDYGEAELNFARAKVLVRGFLRAKFMFIETTGDGIQALTQAIESITSSDICLLMVQLKMAREIGKHKRDNLTDICGYTRLASQLEGDEYA